MCTRRVRRIAGISAGLLLAIVLGAGAASAQQIEIHPYAGGFFPRSSDNVELKKEGVYGLRGGVYLMDFVQVDANFSYINHFTPKNTPDFGSRAYVWDVTGSYSLNNYNIRKAEPFLTIGLGGLNTGLHDAATSTASGAIPKDNDNFLQFSYGGGFKAVRLWGPIGLRADVRGRTAPNFYGSSLTWFEATGGFNIMWGER